MKWPEKMAAVGQNVFLSEGRQAVMEGEVDVRQTLTASEFMDTMIRLGVIGLLVILCLQVF